MKKIGCVGHDCRRCTHGPTRKELRAGYERELRRLLPEWCDSDKGRECIDAWWLAEIVGGMFRAGAKFARTSKRHNA